MKVVKIGRVRRLLLPGWLVPALLVAVSSLGTLLLAVLIIEFYLSRRPLSDGERRIREEQAAYGALLDSASTPRLAELKWVRLRPNTTGRAGRVVRTTNELGFRDVPHGARAREDVFRLVVIGDSYIYGQGIDDVNQLFPRRLGIDRWDGRKVEVFLMGYCGAGLTTYRAMFYDLALGLDPDAVLLTLVSNDLEDRTEPVRGCLPKTVERLLKRTPSLLKEAERRCNNLTHHYERELRRQFDPGSAYFRKGREALSDIKAACRERGIGLYAFFFHIAPDDIGMDAAFRGLAAEQGIPYASLVPLVRGMRKRGEVRLEDLQVSPADAHPGVYANELAARVVTDLLRNYPREGR